MVPASLALDVVPVVIECAGSAFSIQRICRKMRGDLQAKKDKLCTDINNLAGQMLEIEDAEPEGTTLKTDVNRLKSNLEEFNRELQSLVSEPGIKRLFNYNEIEKRLDEALELVARCERSFQTSCTCHLVKAGKTMKTVEQLVLNIQRDTSYLKDEMKKTRRQLHQSQLDAGLFTVKVRSFGCLGARELSYEVKPIHTVSHILNQMRREKGYKINVDHIHFFSWSEQRHALTNTGQDWRYREKNDRLSKIRNECGKRNALDVDWCLEYVCDPREFTIFLVHGLNKETGLIIPLPVDAILDHLKRAYPSCHDLAIVKCQYLQDMAELDWKNNRELEKVLPYSCSLCVEVAEGP